jgi:hypothetical protein
MLTRSGFPSISHRFPRARFRAVAELVLIKPMRRLILALIFLVFSAPLFAQYEIRKSADGFFVVSKVPGRTFSVNVPGKQLTPYGAKTESHPYLVVDGVFLQVLSVPLAEFKGDAKASDERVLKQQMQYEANHYKVPLSQIESQTRKAGGRTVLIWSYVPTFSPRPVLQIFLTLRAGSYVVVIGSAVQPGQTESSIEALLARIGVSFHAT